MIGNKSVNGDSELYRWMEEMRKLNVCIIFFIPSLTHLSTEASTKADLGRIKLFYEGKLKSNTASNEANVKSLNVKFQKQNKVLIEQLVLCRGMIYRLGSIVASLQEKVKEQEQNIEELV